MASLMAFPSDSTVRHFWNRIQASISQSLQFTWHTLASYRLLILDSNMGLQWLTWMHWKAVSFCSGGLIAKGLQS